MVVLAPTEFYGCILVVVVNGKGVIIGNFAQEDSVGTPKCSDDVEALNSREKKFTDVFQDKTDFTLNADNRAFIVYSDDVPETSPSYTRMYENLNGYLKIPDEHIKPIKYQRGLVGGNNDKLAVYWQPNGDGATLKVYIRSDTATFTGNYDCKGIPVGGGSTRLLGRGEPACPPKSSTNPNVPGPTPTCSYHAPQPPIVNEAYCECSAEGKDPAKYDLTSILGKPVPVTESCAYKQMPTKTKELDGPAPETDLANCEVCTPYAENGEKCEKIPDCKPTPKP